MLFSNTKTVQKRCKNDAKTMQDLKLHDFDKIWVQNLKKLPSKSDQMAARRVIFGNLAPSTVRQKLNGTRSITADERALAKHYFRVES